tara:strand:- start:229 stop:453 length:225 start_codon:yes stop_codon:yes gene_type:complete
MGVIKINGYKRKKAESIWGATPDDRSSFPLPELTPGKQASLFCVSGLNGYTQTALLLNKIPPWRWSPSCYLFGV